MSKSSNGRPDESLRTFMGYLCENKPSNLNTIIKSSIDLFGYCVPARPAILAFYETIFEDYCENYWRKLKVSNYMPSLIDMELNPQSPPQTSNSFTAPSLSHLRHHQHSNPSGEMSHEERIECIKSAFYTIIEEYKELEPLKNSPNHQYVVAQQSQFNNLITKWATELLIKLNKKHSQFAMQVASETIKNKSSSNPLTAEIELWLQNPVVRLLVDLMLESHLDMKQLFNRLVASVEACDWILAYLLLEMSKRPIYEKDFTVCMEFITQNMPQLKLNLDMISELLVDKVCATTFDLSVISQLIKLCCISLERVHPTSINICTNHRLCRSLVICFFSLLEYDCPPEDFPRILSYIRVSLTCMSSLRRMSVSSHILCRALLERSFAHGYLFNTNFDPDCIGVKEKPVHWLAEDPTRLSDENLKVTVGHKFRRLPNSRLSDQQRNLWKNKSAKQWNFEDGLDKESINCYLLIQAFKSSINHIEAFASLFVDFLCPVMLDKYIWLGEDQLRVINERDLSILRKFEQIPPLWDLYELIGQQQCLESCLVLVKSLLAAQLALWASSTTKTNTDKLLSTTRLIPPLTQSGLLPRAFGMCVEVFPHLTPNEVFSVLTDMWEYLRDTQEGKLYCLRQHNNARKPKSKPVTRVNVKPYLHTLRLLMCERTPGPLFVKIFKDTINEVDDTEACGEWI